MTDSAWEDALESVLAFLDDPPAPDTQAGQTFDAALRHVLASAPATGLAAPSEADVIAGLDCGLRARLDDLLRRRAPRHPFGDHPDGIGPTLGMDLSKS